MSHRSDLLDSGRRPALGRVVLVSPPSFALMALVSCLAALVLWAYLSVGHYTQRTRLSGVLAAEDKTVPITAAGPGMVVKLMAHEGQAVKAGDVLFVVAEEIPAPATAQPPAAPPPAAQTARHAEATAAAQRLEQLKAESAKVQRQVASQQQRLDAARAGAQRLRNDPRQAADAGDAGDTASPDPRVMRQLDAVLDARTRLQALEATQARLAKDITVAQARAQSASRLAPPPVPLPPPPAAAPASTLRLEYVKAPMDGTVGGALAEPGTPAKNRTLALLTPAQVPLEAQLYASAERAALVERGQKVQLRYRTSPQQGVARGEGVVVGISAAAVAPDAQPEAVRAQGRGESLYRIRVALTALPGDAGRPAPNAGVRVEADILQGARRLLDWAFAAPGEMKGSS